MHSLGKVIGSKSEQLEEFLLHYERDDTDSLGSTQRKLLHSLIYGEYDKLQDISDYDGDFWHVYRLILKCLGRDLKTPLYYWSGVDDVLEEKNYPSSFKLNNLFRNMKPIPGFSDLLPFDEYPYGFYSII